MVSQAMRFWVLAIEDRPWNDFEKDRVVWKGEDDVLLCSF